MNQQPMSILLVEDNAKDRRTISWSIRRRLPEAHIDEAHTGEQCLSYLTQRTREVAAIVLDYELPDMNGIEVLGRLKKLGYMKKAIGFTRFDGALLGQMVSACAVEAFCKDRPAEFLDYLVRFVGH